MAHYDDVFEAEREFLKKRRKCIVFNIETSNRNCYDVIKKSDDEGLLEVFSSKVSFPYEPLLTLRLPDDYVVVREAIEAYEKGIKKRTQEFIASIDRFRNQLEIKGIDA